MEVDDVETGQLLQRFSSMQTQDRKDSIVQMRRLVGGEHALSEAKATFYLEMANWSVPAAVGYYFDLENTNEDASSPESMPTMTFVADVTVGDGEAVPPSTIFVKTWTIRNSGREAWPIGCKLKLSSGHGMGVSLANSNLPPLAPGATTNFSIQMTSPVEPGIYESQWRLSTPTGVYFGDPIWSILTVDPSGTLALTQQLSNLNCQPMAMLHSSEAMCSPAAAGGLPQPYRPTSPTDAQIAVVNSRSVLSRMAASEPRLTPASETDSGGGGGSMMEDDEEMN